MRTKVVMCVIVLCAISFFTSFSVALTTDTFLDTTTGRQIHTVGLTGDNTCHMYFHAQTWSVDSTKLVLSTNIQPDQSCDFVEFDTVTGMTTYLDSSRYYYGVVSHNNKFYYTKSGQIYCIDLDSHQKTLLFTLPGKSFYGIPSISNDGTILGVYWLDSESKPRNISKFNTVTGTFSTIVVSSEIKSLFGDDFITHVQVNPVYKSLFAYARSTSESIQLPDRAWVYDETLDTHKNLYLQKFIDGQLGEYIGHEMWAPDGEKLYFVKYYQSPIHPAGLMWVDKWNSNQYGFINGDYRYLHAAVSPDGKLMVADTRYVDGPVEKESNIVLVNLQTKKSRLLAKINCWADHPGHPHPSFSQDSKKVVFTYADSGNNLRVGYIDISGTLYLKNRKCAPHP